MYMSTLLKCQIFAIYYLIIYLSTTREVDSISLLQKLHICSR